ncbi:MAG: SpoIIE family protein phosphatase [Gemmatimonadaceae bacterium]|nr:SpoIIE family protein phosphatase [Gemmatimonadaceae bacterium]
MSEVAALLAAFREATGREAALWERRDGSPAPTLLGASTATFGERTQAGPSAWDVQAWARTQNVVAHLANTGDSIGWLIVEPGLAGETDRLLGRVIPFVRRLARERDGAASELVGRYEEINLLYAISELLGGTTSVESVAETLLQELAVTVGATRAVFLRTRGQHLLAPIATMGLGHIPYENVSTDSSSHIAARAFRTAGTCTEDGAAARLADPILGVDGEALLAVAITRPSTGIGITGAFPVVTARRLSASASVLDTMSTVPLGVLVLGRERGGVPFSAGDRKLAGAVGTQIGTAMHNASLVTAAVERQQLEREMRLAHDLQLKLLPRPSVVGPEARAAARVVPAESVGGDFFLLARLDRDRTGVLIGDVAGHGYQAALVMALALSAAAIHVQAAFDPSIAVEAVQRSLTDELESTEMSLTLCYAVIDSRVGELRFANAGHPHAFRVGRGGDCTRLGAVAPPIGFSNAPIDECVMAWRPGDRLVLLTDGITDARDAHDTRLGERRVLDVLEQMRNGESPEEMLAGLFAVVDRHVQGMPLRDDLAAVIVDRPQ